MTEALAREVSVEKKNTGFEAFNLFLKRLLKDLEAMGHHPNGRGKCQLVTTREPQGGSDGRVYPNVSYRDAPGLTSLEAGRSRDEESGWDFCHRRVAPQPMTER